MGAVPEGATAPDFDSMTEEEANAHAMASIDAYRSIQQIIAEAESWQDADAAIRAEMGAHPLAPTYEVEQMAAMFMLRQHLVPALSAPTNEVLDATGFYTDVLIRNESPDASLMERTLTALEGHWSPDRVHESAGRAAASAERWALERANCESCSLEEAVARLDSGSRNPANAIPEQTLSSIRALREMAR